MESFSERLQKRIEQDKKDLNTQCIRLETRGLAIVVYFELSQGVSIWNVYSRFGHLLDSSQKRTA